MSPSLLSSARARRAFFCFLAAFLVALSAFAQVKTGFKKLKKHDFEAAQTAFETALEDENEAVAAKWGLAQTFGDSTNRDHNYGKSQVFVAELRALFDQKKLKADERAVLLKKYDLDRKALSTLEKTTTKAAWSELGEEPSLAELTLFSKTFSKKTAKTTADLREKMDAAQQNALSKSTDLAELECLFADHDSLKKRQPAVWAAAEWRQFLAFLNEKGADRLTEFFDENPKNRLAQDVGRDALPTVLQSTSPAPALDFLLEKGESAFAPLAEKRVRDLTNGDEKRLQEKFPNLTSRQKAAFLDVQNPEIFDRAGFSKKYEPSLFAAWDSVIRQRAPGHRSLAAVKKMVSHHLERRESSLVRGHLANYWPLFPADSAWFAAVEKRVRVVLLPQKPHEPPGFLNTAAGEYSPTPTLLGDELFFCRNTSNRESIWRSMLVEGAWTEPKRVAELATGRDQSPLSISADGNQMLFFDDGKTFVAERGAGGNWKKTGPIRADMSQFSWVGFTGEVAGGQILLFEARSLDRLKNDDAATDLYFARREKTGAFGPPIRLPEPINLPEISERSPFLHPDLTTLYFSSARAGGRGGLDVYFSKRLDDTWQNWSQPVSLGDSINTKGFDWCYKISTDGYSAIFSTDVKGRLQDILQAGLPPSARPDEVILKTLDVTGDDGRPMTGGFVVVKNEATGEVIGRFPINGSRVVLPLPSRLDRLVYYVEKKGFLPKTQPIDMAREREAKRRDDLELSKNYPKEIEKATATSAETLIREGQKLELRIFFDFGISTLRPESMPDLEQKADFIKDADLQKIVLEGFTDSVGSDAANLELSQKRVEAVREALVLFGVPRARIEARGMGESDDFENETEGGRQANRRVEMSFLR